MFAIASFTVVVLMISSCVIDFILLWERIPIISFNYFTFVLQAFRENLLINTLTVGFEFYTNWPAPLHRKC